MVGPSFGLGMGMVEESSKVEEQTVGSRHNMGDVVGDLGHGCWTTNIGAEVGQLGHGWWDDHSFQNHGVAGCWWSDGSGCYGGRKADDRGCWAVGNSRQQQQ